MRIVRWAALLGLLAATLGMSLLQVLIRAESDQSLFDATTPLWYIVPGLLVMAKRPWHVVGWMLILVALGLNSVFDAPVSTDPRWDPWLAWVGSWGGYVAYLAVVALLVVFPDGIGARSGRERALGWSLIGVMATLLALAIVSSPVGGGEGGVSQTYPNPLGFGLVPQQIVEDGFLLVFAIILFSVAWMWRRQRREEGTERRRYTLVLFSFALLIVALLFGIGLFETIGEGAWLPAYLLWLWLPIAFSVAVLRHGLYGLDRIVSRTVTYGLVAVVVAAVYVIPVVLLPTVLGEDDLVTAAATLMAAAVFNPVRHRIQDIVDRRFNRARYQADRELQAFAVRLRSQTALDQVVEDLHRVVERTLQPSSAAVWIRG
ncbi:MAG: hypothetical protein EHM57_00445 [Actinobacteria bacterium]|nr:MAG: hypothetical protein EHM57_00445 [Actinomycetota bacterium]